MYISNILSLTLGSLLVSSTFVNNYQAEQLSYIPRIAGGRPVGSKSLDFVAYIQAIENQEIIACTGSLIAPQVVLTAAHCVIDSNSALRKPDTFRIMFTKDAPSDSVHPHIYNVDRSIIQPTFDSYTLRDDIALLMLKEQVSSEVAVPVPLYTGDYTDSTQMLAAGFGYTKPMDKSSAAAHLMEVELMPGSEKYCSGLSASYNSTYNICTNGAVGKDTCSGDSGGPLLVPVDHGDMRKAQIGLTSYSPRTKDNQTGKCAQKGGTGVYTRVKTYVDWIAKETKISADYFSIANETNTDKPTDPTGPIPNIIVVDGDGDGDGDDTSTSTSTSDSDQDKSPIPNIIVVDGKKRTAKHVNDSSAVTYRPAVTIYSLLISAAAIAFTIM